MGVQGYAITHGQTLGVVTFDYDSVAWIAQILDIKLQGAGGDIIDITSMLVQATATAANYGNKKKMPSIYIDGGTLILKVLHDGTQKIPLSDWALNGPDAFVLTIGPYATAQQQSDFEGWVQKYDIDGPMDGAPLTATMTIPITDSISGMTENDDTGAVAVTPAT